MTTLTRSLNFMLTEYVHTYLKIKKLLTYVKKTKTNQTHTQQKPTRTRMDRYTQPQGKTGILQKFLNRRNLK